MDPRLRIRLRRTGGIDRAASGDFRLASSKTMNNHVAAGDLQRPPLLGCFAAQLAGHHALCPDRMTAQS